MAQFPNTEMSVARHRCMIGSYSYFKDVSNTVVFIPCVWLLVSQWVCGLKAEQCSSGDETAHNPLAASGLPALPCLACCKTTPQTPTGPTVWSCVYNAEHFFPEQKSPSPLQASPPEECQRCDPVSRVWTQTKPLSLRQTSSSLWGVKTSTHPCTEFCVTLVLANQS